jgi:hypothetical protein
MIQQTRLVYSFHLNASRNTNAVVVGMSMICSPLSCLRVRQERRLLPIKKRVALQRKENSTIDRKVVERIGVG